MIDLTISDANDVLTKQELYEECEASPFFSGKQ